MDNLLLSSIISVITFNIMMGTHGFSLKPSIAILRLMLGMKW